MAKRGIKKLPQNSIEAAALFVASPGIEPESKV